MHNRMDLTFHLLETITDGFSKEKKLVTAVHKGEEIAVKKLRPSLDLDDKEFDNECCILKCVQHKNIVRLVGYCHESRDKVVDHKGGLICATETQRVLCFEYVQGGSLEQHIRDESCGLDWPTCYKIIRGTCAGLNHLHNAYEKPIYYLDIKPGNILLDEKMTPKIADLGLSRLLDTTKTHRTVNFKGTRGYMPKEYIHHGYISKKFDVFSLGVLIIKIMAGNKGYFSCSEKPPQQFIEHVTGNWRPRLQATSRYSSHEAEILQVKSCVEIALRCVEEDRHKRPTIKDVVHELDKLEAPIELPLSEPGLLNWYYRQAERAGKLLEISKPEGPGETRTEKLLGVHPRELLFPFEPNKRILCHLSLTNKTGYHVVFWVIPSCPDRYRKICYCQGPLQGCECPDRFNNANHLRPTSTRVITVVMEGQQQPPPDTDDFFDGPDADDFILAMITLKSMENITSLLSNGMLPLSSIGSEISTEADFFNRIGLGGEAYVATLTAVVCGPASETMPPHEIISRWEVGNLKSIDVHHTEPWILTSHNNGLVSIWNYQKERVRDVRVTKTTSSVYSAKFIARMECFVAGDGYGYIHVYKFDFQKIKKFKAHPCSPVNSLAVHPTRPFLLSSSQDGLIKLWDWGNGWECTQKFEGHTSSVFQVTFNPKDTDTFASAAASDVKVWTIYSPEPRTTFAGQDSVGYYFADSDPQYMITSSSSRSAYIWDLQRERRVHTLETLGVSVTVVACHRALPILATGLSDGTVCLWNGTNYRLEKVVPFMLGSVLDLGFIYTNDSRRLVAGCRLVVGCSRGIAIMDIKLPTLIVSCGGKYTPDVKWPGGSKIAFPRR